MATREQLFGSDYQADRPPFWGTGKILEGGEIVFIVQKDPTREPQRDVGRTWDNLYIEEQANGKWIPVPQSKLTSGFKSRPLTETVMEVVNPATSEAWTVAFAGKDKEAALKTALDEKNLDGIEVGYAIKIKRGKNDGKRHTITVEIGLPKADK